VSLIGSDKVESTPVYGADNQKIGTVQRVMIDKVSGKVASASWAWVKITILCRGQASSTTSTLVGIASASRKIS
jgi:PRC-barrel domain